MAMIYKGTAVRRNLRGNGRSRIGKRRNQAKVRFPVPASARSHGKLHSRAYYPESKLLGVYGLKPVIGYRLPKGKCEIPSSGAQGQSSESWQCKLLVAQCTAWAAGMWSWGMGSQRIQEGFRWSHFEDAKYCIQTAL